MIQPIASTRHLEIATFQRDAFAPLTSTLGTTPIPVTWDYETVLEGCDIHGLEDRDGFLGVLITRKRPKDVFIESIATAPRARGHKLANALMDHAHDLAQLHPAKTLRLITNAKNPAASWYAKIGFVCERQEHTDKATILHFIKRLGNDTNQAYL